MTTGVNIRPDPFEFDFESGWDSESQAVDAPPLQVSARILWPALGFPAVIAPQRSGSTDPLEGDPSRCICALILSNRRYLSREDAARYLRIVPWSARSRRHIPAGQPGSFNATDIQVRNDDRGKKLLWPKSDALGAAVVFGGSRTLNPGQELEENVIAVSLARSVRDFYRKIGLEHLHEIRVSEVASARFADGQYHLFWNSETTSENVPSNEMQMLLDHFARPRRRALGPAWARHFAFFMDEYKFDYGALHSPYRKDDSQMRMTEILHPVFINPVFVKRQQEPLRVAHVTDTHVDIRADVYEENLALSEEKPARAAKLAGISFNNYNKDFIEVYREAKEAAHVLLLTGDLIDYGRGHVGLSFNGMYRSALGRNDAYHHDRNWFLFYYLFASGDRYTRPAYTILGNHDWRLNPYPPKAPGAPEPESLFHDAKDFSQRDRWKKLIEIAHGPGHERKYAYTVGAESAWGALVWALTHPVRAGEAIAKDFNVAGSPVQTTVESVAWYLMLINPFLDYSAKLPSGQQILMLDWARDEELINPDDPRTFMRFGQRAASSLTQLQQWHVDEFVALKGRAKIIGIHAPPLGPFQDWWDSDLKAGIKKYARGQDSRLRWPDERSIMRVPEHPLLAIRPAGGPYGISAEHGSIVQKRDWLIQKVADPRRGVRLVLSGHIHRNGLLVVGSGKVSLRRSSNLPTSVQNVRVIRGLAYPNVRGLPPPAVARTPETGQTFLGPLYVNTTSAGPRGNYCEGRCWYVSPGYAIISLASDGTIVNVSPRQIVRAIPAPAPARVGAAPRRMPPAGRWRVGQREASVLWQ
jgi:hypothetical protein